MTIYSVVVIVQFTDEIIIIIIIIHVPYTVRTE